MEPEPHGLESDWLYVRRTAVASLLFESLSSSHARSIYEERRMGKTLFLKNEFTTLAESKGYRVIYHSFYMGGARRGIEFILKLAKEGDDTLFARVTEWAVKFVPSNVRAKIGPVEIEKSQQKPESEIPQILSEVFAALKNQRVVLILDEFQEMSKGSRDEIEASKLFLRNLRDCLDGLKPDLKVIFAGSHQAPLRRMFRDNLGAFFGFATEFTLPRFGPEICNELLRRHIVHHRRSFGEEILPFLKLKFMGEFRQNPWRARRLIEIMTEESATPLLEAASRVMSELPDKPSFEKTFADLSRPQKVVLLGLAKGIDQPFSKKALGHFSDMAGVPIGSTTVQKAINSLFSGDEPILIKDSRSYIFHDPDFQNWLENYEG